MEMPGPDASDPDIKLLRLIRLREEPFATARDLEPDMTVGYKQTRNRLDDLVDAGYLKVQRVGRTNVYWLSDSGRQRLAEQAN
jgi:predicted ArsR family transcriptional regulator